ncbi:MAG: TraR/DksA C4-type zinc finger protein [Phycisphaerae bacterium]|nr:TraR/DksA C4-type zinc finger protein [Phycisphaerae bacterium]
MPKSKPQSKKPVKTAKTAAKPAGKSAKASKPSKPAAKPVAKPVAKAAPSKPKVSTAKQTPSKVVAKGGGKPEAKAKGSAAVAKAPTKPGSPVKAGSPGKPGTKAAAPAPASDGKAARKGITIVTPRPVRKPKPKIISTVPASVGQLAGTLRKPLIPSGPHASPSRPLGAQGEAPETPIEAGKSPFNKKELDQFRAILLRKRAEVAGDIHTMESEALKGESGSLSSLPQHMAEQGSENYEQTLALDLVAADRRLVKEIDDALKRIADGTYGLCELTGKPIKAERLQELPWARYSIEAARELERRSMRQ